MSKFVIKSYTSNQHNLTLSKIDKKQSWHFKEKNDRDFVCAIVHVKEWKSNNQIM